MYPVLHEQVPSSLHALEDDPVGSHPHSKQKQQLSASMAVKMQEIFIPILLKISQFNEPKSYPHKQIHF